MARAQKPVKILSRVLAAFVLLLVLAVAALLTWVATGPREVPALNDYVERALNPPGSVFEVRTGNTLLQWDGWRSPVGIHSINTSVLLRDGQIFAELPDVEVSLHVPGLLEGKVQPRRVVLYQPSLRFNSDVEGGVYVGVGEGESKLPVADMLGALAGMGSDSQQPDTDFVVPDIYVRDANVQLITQSGEENIFAPNVQMHLLQLNQHSEFSLQLPFAYRQEDAFVDAVMVLNQADMTASLSLELGNIWPPMLCKFMPDCSFVSGVQVPLAGQVGVQLAQWDVESADFNLKGAKAGVLELPEIFAEPVPIRHYQITGDVSNDYNDIRISEGLIGLKEPTEILFSGNAQLVGEGAAYVDMTASATDMPVEDLYRYWPVGLAPASREWATSSITKGMASKAGVTIQLKPEDFEPEFFPDAFLQAFVEVKGADVRYVEQFAPATKVDGTVYFTGETMRVDIDTAQSLNNTRITNSTLVAPNLNQPATPMEVALNIKSDAQDVLQFLQPKYFPFMQGVDVNKDAVSGTLEGNIELAFDAFSGEVADGEINLDGVKYSVEAAVKDAAYPSYDGQWDIAVSAAQFKADANSLSFDGRGSVNTVPVQFAIEDKLSRPALYTLNSATTIKQLEKLGLPVQSYVKGPVQLKARITQEGTIKDVDLDVKLDAATIDVAEVGWRKPAGEAAQLMVKRVPDVEAEQLAFKLTSQAASAEGVLTLDDAMQAVNTVNLRDLRFGDTRIGLVYSPMQNGYRIKLTGEQLDLSSYMEQSEDSNPSISNFPPLHLDIDVGRILLAKEQAISDVNGYLYCNHDKCNAARLHAKLAEGKHFDLLIDHENGARTFSLTSNDAGRFLGAFDMVSNMYGGTLNMQGTYDDSKPTHPLVGRLIIEEFLLRDAPVLGRILSLGSLEGLVNTLTGKGIGFDKFSGDFVFADDALSFKSTKMVGSSLGITAEGDVSLKNAAINLKGTLVPVYAVNSLLSKIPLVGEALAGGEGQGILGINYSVKGDYNDPSVLVNPLSAFTPGFLRNLFDVFDQPAKPANPTNGEAEAAPANTAR